MGWKPHLKHPRLASVRIFPITGFKRILILYRPEKDHVDILRVIQASRNVQALLRREGPGS